MNWVNLLHIYQPFWQTREILDKVVEQSYKKILFVLENNSSTKVNINICAGLTEQLIVNGYDEIVDRLKKLAIKGQIEFVDSAKYHPILPLLPTKEIIRQIKLNNSFNKKYFGKTYNPTGFFLPELAYSKKTARIIKSLGYKWIILDEIAYNNSFGEVCFDQQYFLRDFFDKQHQPFKIIFRNRGLSLLFFHKWLDSVEKFWQAVNQDIRSSEFLVTAFDGESLGHHQAILIDVWENILKDNRIKTIFFSEYLKQLNNKQVNKIVPIKSSWSTEIDDIKKDRPYPLWDNNQNKLHQLQWKITYLVLNIVKNSRDNPNHKQARDMLDKALHSDQYWWASANPWWSKSPIKKGLNQFEEIIKLLI
ncbi:hypothetical protein ISS06_01275 [Patescibacteria group bacterium]|nr:hypothetical protein [Patescibacteria group bacterium]